METFFLAAITASSLGSFILLLFILEEVNKINQKDNNSKLNKD